MSLSYSITQITSTICELMDLPFPKDADIDFIDSVMKVFNDKNIDKIDKFLFYAPDAIGKSLVKKFPNEFDKIRKLASTEVEMISVYPTKTPVCFASMLTGTLPEVHGIQSYKKNVLYQLSLFDSLVLGCNPDNVVNVAVKDSTLDLIFRDRPMEYYSEKYDKQVNDRAIQLIENKDLDFILVYNQEYDDSLHSTGIESPQSIAAMKNHVQSFIKLVKVCETNWSGYNRAYLFAPDHGAHDDPETGKGTHGEKIPDDMEIVHFWGIYKKRD
ncbi:alkaline phosphatase family protein [Candidatus Dependentiae bacterium]|nr:alkaline phosphatase family protein [Candidatus Dependentiae bacterium]